MNLVEVHDSLGFLDKLENLSFYRCTNLSTLPHCIKLTSLTYLNLDFCWSLMSFPNLLGLIEHTRDLRFRGTGIKEFPFSFRNLIGLESIILLHFETLYQVLTSIFMLPRFHKITAINCGCHQNLILSNGEEEQERVSLTVSLSIRFAMFKQCRFPNDTLTTLLSCLPNLECLFLTFSAFTILPACISECRFLRSLVLDGCSSLQEIKGIPPNIKYLSAINCTSLTYQSQSILLSQALHEGGGTNFCLPGFLIPEWFDHSTRGPILSFWFRERFPSVALCVVGLLDDPHKFPISKFSLLINGIQRLHFHLSTVDSVVKTEHINLLDLQLKFYKGETERIYIEAGWNHAELSYMQPQNGRKGSIKWMGVHVYKQKTCMNNIRFTNPKLPERTCDDFLNSNKEMEACEAPNNRHQWQVQRDGCEGISVCQSLWKEISSIEASQKTKILIWNICEDTLPTYEYLYRRKLVDSPVCLICEKEAETIEHVFLKCAWTRPIWFGSNVQWSVDMDSVHSFPVWFCQKLEGIKRVHPNANKISALMVSICWAIWKGRNELVLEDKPVNPMSALINLGLD